jgi:ABC-type cobalamin transport system permease subunit
MNTKTHWQTGAVMSGLVLKHAARTTILAAGSALALITATAGDRAHGEGNLDASYTISFARIPVGEVTATAIFGQSEYAISARARVLVVS